jgi:Tol biopolymer transport system component
MRKLLLILTICSISSCSEKKTEVQDAQTLLYEGEKHLANVKQLTREGENSAEAYLSFDAKQIIFQSTRGAYACDQIFTMNADGSDVRLVSTGKGRATCAYFLKDGRHIIYSSTHAQADTCPPKPDFSRGYVWAVYPSYDIYVATDDGSELRPLTTTPGYDAEATLSPDGKKIVFTSLRDGDLEIYTMDVDGSNVQRLTNTVGYDGGPFYSADGSKIVYRAHHPDDPDEIAAYKSLLQQNLIQPSKLDIFVMNADGTGQRRITDNGAANFAPFFHPDGERIIFCSNLEDPQKRNFDLFMISTDGSRLERVTFHEQFDGFPMFTPDGKKLVFCSNRNAGAPHQTNVFIADWIE